MTSGAIFELEWFELTLLHHHLILEWRYCKRRTEMWFVLTNVTWWATQQKDINMQLSAWIRRTWLLYDHLNSTSFQSFFLKKRDYSRVREWRCKPTSLQPPELDASCAWLTSWGILSWNKKAIFLLCFIFGSL